MFEYTTLRGQSSRQEKSEHAPTPLAATWYSTKVIMLRKRLPEFENCHISLPMLYSAREPGEQSPIPYDWKSKGESSFGSERDRDSF